MRAERTDGGLRWALVVAMLLVAAWRGALAQPASAGVDVYLYWRIGCPHCERAIEFLDRAAAQNPAVRLHKREVSAVRANAREAVRVAERLRVESGSVPLIVIGERAWVGYHEDATTGAQLRAQINACLAQMCPDLVAGIGEGTRDPPKRAIVTIPETLRVPLVGEVRTDSLSLPVLTVALAAVDGFNPCALWVLVFLLGLLAGMQDRLRMWVLGGAFVATSAVVYLLILTAWLNLLLFVGSLEWVRIGIGVFALGAGGWYLRGFLRNDAAVCEVTAPEARQRVLARLRELALERSFLPALGGIVLLALAVNVVEFLCSAGIPAVFTQVLALSELSRWQYAAYLLLYLLVFMADDMVVLVVALKTLEVTGLTTTYARWSGLVGAVVLAAIGVILIARPDWLAVG